MKRLWLACSLVSILGSSLVGRASAQDAVVAPASSSDTPAAIEGEATPRAVAPAPIDVPAASPGGDRATSLRAPMTTSSGSVSPDPSATPPLAAPLSVVAEIAIGVTPTFGADLSGAAGLGVLSSLGGIGGRTDFAFAASPRFFVGFGLDVAHRAMARSGYSSGLSEDRLALPLVAQLYLDAPRHGATVPTLRIMPAFRWTTYAQETFDGAGFSTTRGGTIGGLLEVGIGITWFVADAFAVRVLGDLGVSADFSTSGRQTTNFAAYVGANLGVVVRL